jgi:hypothetical protein
VLFFGDRYFFIGESSRVITIGVAKRMQRRGWRVYPCNHSLTLLGFLCWGVLGVLSSDCIRVFLFFFFFVGVGRCLICLSNVFVASRVPLSDGVVVGADLVGSSHRITLLGVVCPVLFEIVLVSF